MRNKDLMEEQSNSQAKRGRNRRWRGTICAGDLGSQPALFDGPATLMMGPIAEMPTLSTIADEYDEYDVRESDLRSSKHTRTSREGLPPSPHACRACGSSLACFGACWSHPLTCAFALHRCPDRCRHFCTLL